MENKKSTDHDSYITTYIINRKERMDRLNHIESQFLGKTEFQVNIFEACENKNGKRGLWDSIVEIIKLALQNDEDVIVICEDDHEFTSDYSPLYLFDNIFGAHNQSTDILIGGIGGFGIAVPVDSNRYWLDWFWCTQFIVVYRKFFNKILSYEFTEADAADEVISKLSNKKMALYPFISVQKDFGYSDVTEGNNDPGKVTQLFSYSNSRLEHIHRVSSYFNYPKIETKE